MGLPDLPQGGEGRGVQRLGCTPGANPGLELVPHPFTRCHGSRVQCQPGSLALLRYKCTTWHACLSTLHNISLGSNILSPVTNIEMSDIKVQYEAR